MNARTDPSHNSHLQKPGQYAIGDDHALLSVAAHDGVFNEVERLETLGVVLRVQIVNVVTRRFRVHDEYRMRHHGRRRIDETSLFSFRRRRCTPTLRLG